jgi:hypothetical protein
MVVLVMLGTIASLAVLVPDGLTAATLRSAPAMSPPASFLAANLLFALVAAVVGGWLAARIAPSSPRRHVLALGALVVVMSIVVQLVPGAEPNGQPAWYPWAIATIGIAGIIFGGWLRTRARSAA